MKRVLKRNRPGEAGKVTMEYLEKLNELYNRYLEKL